jgi:hypothetical protein
MEKKEGMCGDTPIGINLRKDELKKRRSHSAMPLG